MLHALVIAKPLLNFDTDVADSLRFSPPMTFSKTTGWMPENISGVPAGKSVFHSTSPLVGLLAPANAAAPDEEVLEIEEGNINDTRLYRCDPG
jgi:hypothetical protein